MKAGILYDNISGNIGDRACGLSVHQILTNLNIEHELLFPGHFKASDYDAVIIGGGLLLRESPDFFYDKFKIPGKNILNCVGVLGYPDTDYLNDYRYVTVRSTGDAERVNQAIAVPCTAMILENDLNIPVEIKAPSLGIQVSASFRKWEKRIIKYLNTLDINIYFIPINHHGRDIRYMSYLSEKIPRSKLIPIMTASEVKTTISRFDYMISGSMHGGIFAYAGNVPFALIYLEEKHRYFMQDRGLETQDLCYNWNDVEKSINHHMEGKTDYSHLIRRDMVALSNHQQAIKDALPDCHYVMNWSPSQCGIFDDQETDFVNYFTLSESLKDDNQYLSRIPYPILEIYDKWMPSAIKSIITGMIIKLKARGIL